MTFNVVISRGFLLPTVRQPSAVIARVLNKNAGSDGLETIDNSQSTNSAKTLKIFNVYSSLGL